MPHKIILDTDPGIDDAMAIFMALAHPDIDLLGITTTFGNVSVTQATHNALGLLTLAEVTTIPVAMGASRPSGKSPLPYPEQVHGSDGLGNTLLPTPSCPPIQATATQFMIDQIRQHPGEITLVAIGPLGNLAQVLDNAPELAGQVKQVVLMGGTLNETGNVSPVAEANMFCDPHAADKVMAADWPVVMLGLDVTHRVLLSRDLFADIAQHNPTVGAFMQEAAEYYINFYEREREADNGCYGHDISALAYVIDPKLFETQLGSVCVVTEGTAAGQTIMNTKPKRHYALPHWDNRPQQIAAITVDAQSLVRLFHDTLCNRFWQR